MTTERSGLGRRRWLQELLLAFTGYVALMIAITWPLVLHITSWIPGGGGGDPAGYAWDVWNAANNGTDIWGTGVQHGVAAPFGRPVVGTGVLMQFASYGPSWLIAEIAGPEAGINIALILGVAFSGAAMYALVRWMGLSAAASAWAGLAFVVFPHHLLKIGSHFPLAYMACFPLALLAALWWARGPSVRRALAVTASVGFAWLSNPYYGVMVIIMVACVMLVAAVYRIRTDGFGTAIRQSAVVAGLLLVLVAIPLAVALASSKSGVDAAFSRSAIELELYGARPLDYLLPSGASDVMNRLVGPEDWAPHARPGGERTIFLMWTVIALALAGFVIAVRRRMMRDSQMGVTVLSMAMIAVVCGAFSLASPMTILGRRVTMPSGYLFQFADYLRVYARFAVPVTCALIVVGAIALDRVLGRIRPVVLMGAAAAGVMLVTVAEANIGLPVAAGPVVSVNGLAADKVPTWEFLKSRPREDVVLETPAYGARGGSVELEDRYWMWGQTVHGLRIANGSLGEANVATDFLQSVGDPRFPGTAAKLAATGIDLVTINPAGYAARGAVPPNPNRPPPGYRVLTTFADGSAVWQVTAAPTKRFSFLRAPTWWPPEAIGGETWRWMRDTAEGYVWSSTTGTARVTFRVGSFGGRQYTLSASTPAAKLATINVTGAPRNVTLAVPVTAGTATKVTLTRGGAPAVPVNAGDPRVVSVRVSEWRVEQ